MDKMMKKANFQMVIFPCLAVLLLVWALSDTATPANGADSALRTISNHRALAPASPISREELDFCTDSMEAVAEGGEVGPEDFILFLENFSDRSLIFDEFQELPLQLILVFYTAACSAGRNCSTDEPKISLTHVGASQAFLAVFCASVKELAVVQIFYNFQYLVQYGPSSDRTTLIGKLEEATQGVLLDDFGCNTKQVRRHMETSRSGRDFDESDRHLTSREHMSWRNLQLVGVSDCDFSVQARIHRTREMECSHVQHREGERGDVSDDSCTLVFSEVKVTAASLFEELSEEELRLTVAATLKGALTSDQFNQWL